MDQIPILFVLANPKDSNSLQLLEELRDIIRKLRASRYGDLFSLKILPAPTIDDLEQELVGLEPIVLHFSGHGAPTYGLLMHDELTTAGSSLNAEDLSGMLKVASPKTRLVFLNACHTSPLARQLCRHVDFVIGVDSQICDTAAQRFSASFYRGIGFGRSIKESFKMGQVSMKRSGLTDEGRIAQLWTRDGAVVSESLWDRSHAKAQATLARQSALEEMTVVGNVRVGQIRQKAAVNSPMRQKVFTDSRIEGELTIGTIEQTG